jgi:hypothetical protein
MVPFARAGDEPHDKGSQLGFSWTAAHQHHFIGLIRLSVARREKLLMKNLRAPDSLRVIATQGQLCNLFLPWKAPPVFNTTFFPFSVSAIRWLAMTLCISCPVLVSLISISRGYAGNDGRVPTCVAIESPPIEPHRASGPASVQGP